jgi:Rieske Fe-S protein
MTEDHGLTRRQALAAVAALCGVGALTVAGTAQAANHTLRVQLSKFPALRKVGGVAVVGSLNGTQVAVVRTGPSTYLALDRRCPHAGGIVTASGSGWVCPLHGSRFDKEGGRVSGLTPTGLRRLNSRLVKGILSISG